VYRIRLLLGSLALTGLVGLLTSAVAAEGRKKIVFLAGRATHGYGSHEHYAGGMLLARLLKENMPNIGAVVHRGWPKDAAAFEGADAIVIDCDAGSLITAHLAELDKLMKRGAGLACFHYTLVVPKGKPGERLLDWIGGYYETHWSVNPTWEAHFKELPKHPITRGVKPFEILDEWYYHMRFRKDMEGVAPILTAVPPDATRKRRDGAHSGNPHVRARMGMPEHVAWAYVRPGGGRGFGFTGAHLHWNWAHDDYRKVVLNALVWVAGAEVPPNGVPSKRPTVEELKANLGGPRPRNWPPGTIQRIIDSITRPSAR